MGIRLFIKDIYEFYRYDCCWPYAASFFLTLGIYWLDFFVADTPYHWGSLAAYAVIFAYYLYNLRLYFQGKVMMKNSRFSLVFLSSKITIWGAMLVALYLIKSLDGARRI